MNFIFSFAFFSETSGQLLGHFLKSINPAPIPPPIYPGRPPIVGPPSSIGRGCPLCDRSVYSYCSHKMIHDACCCHPGRLY